MSRVVVLDIETLPAEDDRVERRAEREASGYCPPANLRDPAKIQERRNEWAAGLDAEVDAEWRKTALSASDGGRVFCVGYAILDRMAGDTSGVLAWTPPEDSSTPISPFGAWLPDERAMLQTLWHDVLSGAELIVGHNIIDFDLRYLWQRSVILDVRPSLYSFKRYSSSPVFDTMQEWVGWDRTRYISLNKLCRLLGIPSSKGDMDGSKVYDFWAAGEYGAICDYCLDDVRATVAVYQKLRMVER